MTTVLPLPTGWHIDQVTEYVPDPNAGTPAARTFLRATFICTDDAGNYVCASGTEQDCYSQALSVAQSRTQQQPYDGGPT